MCQFEVRHAAPGNPKRIVFCTIEKERGRISVVPNSQGHSDLHDSKAAAEFWDAEQEIRQGFDPDVREFIEKLENGH